MDSSLGQSFLFLELGSLDQLPGSLQSHLPDSGWMCLYCAINVIWASLDLQTRGIALSVPATREKATSAGGAGLDEMALKGSYI